MTQTLVSDATLPAFDAAIRNPANAGHLMVLQEVAPRVKIWLGDVLLADTVAALRLVEVGKQVYVPRLYVPREDVKAALVRSDKSTHCPLKGDAFYLELDGQEVAWGYDTLDFAERLSGYVSFDAAGLRVEETFA
ncbi:MAG: DUF427 domain-containing protein [Thalassovita sp.]